MLPWPKVQAAVVSQVLGGCVPAFAVYSLCLSLSSSSFPSFILSSRLLFSISLMSTIISCQSPCHSSLLM